jgi:uncharacterized protein (TIRG00374 family)
MKRRWIYWLLIIAFFWLIVSRFDELSDFSLILTKGNLLWVLAAVVLQLLYYVATSASYQAAFTTVGIDSRLRDLFPLLFGVLFVNVVAPTGGASGVALFVEDGVRHGQSPVRTAAAIVIQFIISLIAFTVILAAGLAYLASQNRLQFYYLVASVILLLGIIFMSGVILLATRRPAMLRLILGRLQSGINWAAGKVKQIPALSDEWIDRHVAEFEEAGAAITAHPIGLVNALWILLLAHLVNIAGLDALFLAFSQSIGSLVAGYSVGFLFLFVSITPQGVGIVEGVMPVVFGSLGVPSGIATLTVLAFRGLTFWLPLALGFFLLRRMDTFRVQPPPSN